LQKSIKNDKLKIKLFRVWKMKIKVTIEKGEDGYFVAHCPSLKSCWSQGKTEEEALKNIREDSRVIFRIR